MNFILIIMHNMNTLDEQFSIYMFITLITPRKKVYTGAARYCYKTDIAIFSFSTIFIAIIKKKYQNFHQIPPKVNNTAFVMILLMQSVY